MNKRILILLVGILATACAQKDPYAFDRFFAKEVDQVEQMAKIISYVYVTPPQTKPMDRVLPEHRAWYKGRIREFEMLRYHIDAEDVHHFYLLRPARSAQNNKRGVGGRFRMDEIGEIYDYEELWVTSIIPAENVRRFAAQFWYAYMNNGNVEMYYSIPEMVEFPNEQTYYDAEALEWRYKVSSMINPQ